MLCWLCVFYHQSGLRLGIFLMQNLFLMLFVYCLSPLCLIVSGTVVALFQDSWIIPSILLNFLRFHLFTFWRIFHFLLLALYLGSVVGMLNLVNCVVEKAYVSFFFYATETPSYYYCAVQVAVFLLVVGWLLRWSPRLSPPSVHTQYDPPALSVDGLSEYDGIVTHLVRLHCMIKVMG